MKHRLALIHTSPVLVPAFDAVCRAKLPHVARFHIVDESLLQNTIASGRLEKPTVRRLAAEIGSAVDAGATAVLVTCSSIGPGVAVARSLFDQPVFRVDEEMARRAVAKGARIGVLATLRTTLEPTVELIRDAAAAAAREREVVHRVCDGAFQAVVSGDTAAHDRMVSDALLELSRRVDVVVLAQASMARVLAAMPPGALAVPVLTSPELAVEQVARDLSS